jgi:parvulin-like peptidyl-prolyl isomerase
MALTVNGQKIEDLAIRQEAERLRPDYERVFAELPAEEREAQLLEWSRENVIETVLINQQAQKTGKPIPDSEIEAALVKVKEQYLSKGPDTVALSIEEQTKIKKDIEMHIKVERLLAEVCKDVSEPSKDDIVNFYNENKEQLKSAEQIKVSHIVKHMNWQIDQADANNMIEKALNELKQGAIFEVLAAKYSDCPDNGGDLGFITKGQMVEEFEDVVFNMDVGEISDIFRTRFGFHIAKVYNRKPAAIPPFKEVKDRIVEKLKEQMRRQAIEHFVDHLKSEAKIEET